MENYFQAKIILDHPKAIFIKIISTGKNVETFACSR